MRPVPFCSLLMTTALVVPYLTLVFTESYLFRVGCLIDIPVTTSQVLGLQACATKPSSSELKGLTVVEEKELALQITSST